MIPLKMNRFTDNFLWQVLQEDIGQGDLTTQTTIPEDSWVQATLIAKDQGVLCGIPLFRRVFFLLDESINVKLLVDEGSWVEPGMILAEMQGPARNLLTGERVALNLLQRLSGVATATKRAVSQIEGSSCKIIDTRKTTPGLRLFEKYAVRIGGGFNHRFNLSDGILIKDNHIRAAGGITSAVKSARLNSPHTMKIEVEVENFEQVQEAVESGAEILLLDNMSLAQMKEAVEWINGRALTEASGNMGSKDLREVAATGVDMISIGALTHSVKSLDLSVKFLY
jgi:nicotinate-nucleotide pyrophosphorylase (carboxylating)